MILVAGGTGTLGTRVVQALTERGTPVRVLTRNADRAAHLTGVQVEVGDVRDPEAVASAMRGVTTVVSAIQGFAGTEPVGLQAVDVGGNANLTRAALAAGTRRFVLVSADRAAPDSQLLLRRIKYQVEQALMDSGLEWTVIRPAVYLESWIGILGGMIATKGTAMVFGRGDNPINFVSAHDVAALVEQATRSADLAGAVLEIGGPENLTLNELAGRLLPQDGKIRHVPLPVLRAMAAVLRPIKPMQAGLAQFGITMDTTDMTLAADTARAKVPDLPVTRLADLLAADNGTKQRSG